MQVLEPRSCNNLDLDSTSISIHIYIYIYIYICEQVQVISNISGQCLPQPSVSLYTRLGSPQPRRPQPFYLYYNIMGSGCVKITISTTLSVSLNTSKYIKLDYIYIYIIYKSFCMNAGMIISMRIYINLCASIQFWYQVLMCFIYQTDACPNQAHS